VPAARLTAQLLAGPPAKDPVAVAERLLAVQGQDPRGFRLAVRARTEGLTAADVDRALTEDRSLLVTWLNRGTLHLVRSEDYPLLQSVTTPPLRTSSERRLGQEGLPPDHAKRAVRVIEHALAEEGPLPADELRKRVATAGLRSEGQALYHLLFSASLDGLVVRGPMVNRKHAYVLVRDWLGEQKPVDRDRALAEVARRYLAGHGPATDRDLARWAGISLGDARAGLGAAGDPPAPEPAELPPPKLLGAFDPVLLGWVSREDVIGAHTQLVTDNGMFHPFALVGGRAMGRWRFPKGRVELEPFEKLRRADAAALERDARDVERFLG
jgi:hypothetical protein